jgi:hypothetical protein
MRKEGQMSPYGGRSNIIYLLEYVDFFSYT